MRSASNSATIGDIARLAGVSIKTVSLVINHNPGVSISTRQAVKSAILSLSYKPNVFARALAGKRSYLVGLLFDDESGTYITDLEAGALATCHEEGFHMIVECVSTQDARLLAKVRSFIAVNKVRGFILTPPLCDSKVLLDELVRLKVRIVRIAPSWQDLQSVAINIDDYGASYHMTRHLLDLGHRRIAFIKGKQDHSSAIARFEGYRAALDDANVPFFGSICEQGDYSYESGLIAAGRIFSRASRPTAVFASNDDMAAGVLAACQKCMLRVPDQVSLVGFDDSMIAQIVWPQLTTCRQPVKQMGAAAASAIIHGGCRKDLTRRFDYEIVVRSSTAPPGS